MIECICMVEKIYGSWQYEYVIVSNCERYAIRIFAGFEEEESSESTFTPDILFGLYEFSKQNPKWLSPHIRADLNDISNIFPEFGELLLKNMDIVNVVTQSHPSYPSFNGLGFKQRIVKKFKPAKYITRD